MVTKSDLRMVAYIYKCMHSLKDMYKSLLYSGAKFNSTIPNIKTNILPCSFIKSALLTLTYLYHSIYIPTLKREEKIAYSMNNQHCKWTTV